MARAVPLQGGEAGADQLAEPVELFRAHVWGEAGRVRAADGQEPRLARGAEGNEGRGQDGAGGGREEGGGVDRVQGAALDHGLGRGGGEDQADGLGVEFPAQPFRDQGLQCRPVRGQDEVDRKLVQPLRQGLVIPGAGDELCQTPPLPLHLGPQQSHLMLHQGQGARGAMGQS